MFNTDYMSVMETKDAVIYHVYVGSVSKTIKWLNDMFELSLEKML